jgi:hypothetical protein
MSIKNDLQPVCVCLYDGKKKTIFPHNFLNDKFNPNINLEYICRFPKIEYFDLAPTSGKEYTKALLNFMNSSIARNNASNWNLRDEIINYCFSRSQKDRLQGLLKKYLLQTL